MADERDLSVGNCPDCGRPLFAEHAQHTCPTVLFESDEGPYTVRFETSYDRLTFNRTAPSSTEAPNEP